MIARAGACLAIVFALFEAPALAAVPAPDRALTDPQSLKSLVDSKAAPIPITDLGYLKGAAAK